MRVEHCDLTAHSGRLVSEDHSSGQAGESLADIQTQAGPSWLGVFTVHHVAQ